MVVLNNSLLLPFFLFLQPVIGSTESYQYIGDCASLLQEFATSAADFMLCAISNARPIHMCSSCVGAYNGVMEGHKRILEISESSNITCKDRLINLDRLEIIEAGFTYVTELWDKGRCPSCFVPGDNLPFQPSNTTLEFNRLYQDTDSCLKSFFISENGTYSAEVCRNCTLIYQKMNKFYDHLKIVFGDGQLCMDIVDSMNITQNLWSGQLHCGKEIQTPEVGLLASCVTVLFLPIIFYLSTWMMSQTDPAPVSRQKRLSTRFMERWRSRSMMEGSFTSFRRSS